MRAIHKALALLSIAALLVLCAGCEQETADGGKKNDSPTVSSRVEKNSNSAPEKEPAPDGKSQEKVRAIVYYPDENAEKLLPVSITVDSGDKYKKAIERLYEGTPPKGYVRVMPPSTKVYSVTVEKNLATVDFSKEFVKNFSGGSAGEIMLVGSIANTLTDFDEIDAVKITVEGHAIDTLSGHLDLSEPLKFNAKLVEK